MKKILFIICLIFAIIPKLFAQDDPSETIPLVIQGEYQIYIDKDKTWFFQETIKSKSIQEATKFAKKKYINSIVKVLCRVTYKVK